MEALVRFSLKQRVFYNLLFVMLIVAGSFAFLSLPAERYPNVHFGEVTVSTQFPGASPEEVETLVTRKIEDALESIEDLEWISATSFRQRSYVRMKFIDDADYDTLFDEVRFRVLNIQGELPGEVDPPVIWEALVDNYLPVVVVNLAGDRDNRALALMADTLKAPLKQIHGIKDVRVSGEYIREFHVYLEPDKLRALGISFDQVAQALQESNLSIPAGNFNNLSGEFTVKVDEKFRSRDQVLSTILRHDADGSFVRVSDVVSRAGLDYRDPIVISSINGKNALALQIIKAEHGNALDIKAAVLETLEELRPIFESEGVELVLTQDSTIYINDALGTLGMNMLVGMVLVSLILWYFMGARNAVLVTIGVPFSFMITILLMYLTGKVPLIRIQFFPDDYRLYYVDLEGPSSTPIEEIDRRVKQISEFILADGPGKARSTAGFAGFIVNDDYEQIFGNNRGTVMVSMPTTDQQDFDDPLQHLDWMRERLNPVFASDGFRIRVHAQKDGPPAGKDINVRVLGDNQQSIDQLADELLKFMRNHTTLNEHLVELKDDRGLPKRVFRFRVRHEQVSEYGLNSEQVSQLAASVLDGRYIGKYRLSDEEVDLKISIDPDFLTDPADALRVPLVESANSSITLADVTRLEAYNEPGDLNRYQGHRSISIKANIRAGVSTSTPAVVATVTEYYNQIRDKYPGATVIFGGEHEDTQRSYQSLAYAFIIAVLTMYLILATQFQSYLQPLIILSAIVFALIGVVFGKLLTQSLFTVNSFIAVIGVAGVVVNDTLVLIDFINKRYREGKSRREAIELGVRIRLRPIVLTTLTTTLGLLPMAVGFPSYSLVWGAMASTFVAGLATATALTLFIVPVLWDLLQGWQERRERKIQPGSESNLG